MHGQNQIKFLLSKLCSVQQLNAQLSLMLLLGCGQRTPRKGTSWGLHRRTKLNIGTGAFQLHPFWYE